jgi:CRISPR-associated endonuclease/helicase Cas3
LNNQSYYAHSREGVEKADWQRLIEHLTNTSKLAAEMGKDAGISDLTALAGLMHDIGKYSLKFQRRLDGSSQRVDHSTAGAQEIMHLFNSQAQNRLAEFLAYCIAGHHSGLPDPGSVLDMEDNGTLTARLKIKLEDYSAYRTEIDPSRLRLPEHLHIRPLKGNQGKQLIGFSLAFLTRMVYSCLVDADFQDTQEYMDGKKQRGDHESIEELCQKFNQSLSKYKNPTTEINRKRTETLKACVTKAKEERGFFTLTVPTGGGKTLASMAFAINHAVKHELKRIIYVIPFTSIIEQNASVFKEILGENNILEHHSNFDWEKTKREATEVNDSMTDNAYEKLKLAAENWDIPIVVTTNVQFFESLFANRSSRCRKLHNLAQSVIIFDEAQMLPRDYMYPAMYAIWELVTNYGASAVFCTATQPVLQKFMPEGTAFKELAPNPQELFAFYRRVEVIDRGSLADAELLAELNSKKQAVCIVNTRKHAKGLFDGLEEEGRFHLSTLMCPAHRKKTLLEIRKRLRNEQVCRVVSTQVMEAGIDVDFPVGYRSLAGLDSIIQAAGRVNREGKQPSGEVYVFEPDSEFVKRIPKYIEQGAAVARSTLREFRTEPVCIAAIENYFGNLYSLQDEKAFDVKGILGLFNDEGFNFRTAAEEFQIIENHTMTVIIPYNDESEQQIKKLRFSAYPGATIRKLQPFVVNIYEEEYEALNSKGAIEIVGERYAVLNNMSHYHPETGISIPESGDGEAIFY